MPMLSEKEQKDLVKELHERTEAELAKKQHKIDEIDMIRADIAQEIAMPEEIASMRETKEQLVRELAAVREAVNDDMPTGDEAKKIRDLSDRIEELDATLYRHDPN